MLNKVTGYKIIACRETDNLESEVNTALNKGWTPSGPVFEHDSKLNQVMVKFS